MIKHQIWFRGPRHRLPRFNLYLNLCSGNKLLALRMKLYDALEMRMRNATPYYNRYATMNIKHRTLRFCKTQRYIND